MKTGLCVFLVAAVFFDFFSDVEAGEIIKKTYYDSKGRAVGKYVYQAGRSRRSYAHASRLRYPVYQLRHVHLGPVYSPAVYRVYRPMALSQAAYTHTLYSHGVYHSGWISGHFSLPMRSCLIAPQRLYYRR